ncbi:MAG: leucine-rich repeat domain-containing protein, partial [Clostridia bacterium]|nr:leucine-rich repeat domain-containing protein [Clostridia bacterium]
MKRSVKLLSALLALLVTMVLTPLGTVAESAPIERVYVEGWGTWYYIVEDGGATLTNYGGDGESFYLPDTLGGYPLKVIGESACAYLDWLTEVDIPDSVVELRYGAFDMCTFLKTVNMGDNLEVIGEAAFRGCEFLTDVNFGAGVKVIENNAFDSCYSLKEIAIPDGVEVLQDRTFDRCSGLQSVYLPDSLYFIGNDAFSLCESLREITIPEGVVYIGEYAFNGCSSLEQIALPATVGYVQEAAFRFCDSLTDVYYSGTQEARDLTNIAIENDPLNAAVWHYGWIGPMPPLEELPDASETSPDYFYRTYVDGGVMITGYWGSATDIVIPGEIYGDPVVAIDDSAFSYSDLTSVVIPEGVTDIGEYAFSKCERLVSVSLPSTLVTVGNGAFNGCTSLSDVVYNGTEEQAALIAIGTKNDALLNAAWRYADGGEEPEEPEGPLMTEDGFYYEVGDDGNVTITRYAGEGGDVVIPDEIDGYPVIAVGNHTFWNNQDVTSVTIPDSVTRIGNSAFAKCEELTSVVIGDGVTTIGYRAFAETDNLTDVVVGDGVKRIEARAFYASGITSMVLPDTVEYIGEYAFAECKALASINIPASLETINDKTFYKCESLQSIVFPESLYEIRGMAFSQSGLT